MGSKWLHNWGHGCLSLASPDSLPQLEYRLGRKGSSSHDFAVDEMVELDDDKGMKASWSPWVDIVICINTLILWPGKP